MRMDIQETFCGDCGRLLNFYKWIISLIFVVRWIESTYYHWIHWINFILRLLTKLCVKKQCIGIITILFSITVLGRNILKPKCQICVNPSTTICSLIQILCFWTRNPSENLLEPDWAARLNQSWSTTTCWGGRYSNLTEHCWRSSRGPRVLIFLSLRDPSLSPRSGRRKWRTTHSQICPSI